MNKIATKICIVQIRKKAIMEMIEIGANTPFLLNDNNAVWLVQSGTVEIYAVHLKNGKCPKTTADHRNVTECIKSDRSMIGRI